MKAATSAALRIFFYSLAAGLLAVVFGFMPGKASADEILSQTVQVLPFGSTDQCAPLPITDYTLYEYDGALNSFDFSYPDASYVVVVGSVGEQAVPLNFMRRQIDGSNGSVRMHIDTETTPVVGMLPIQMTLLSSGGPGTPLCAATVTIRMYGAAAPTMPAPAAPAIPITPEPPPAPEAPTSPATGTPEVHDGGVATSSTVGITKGLFERACSATGDAYRLWVALLVLYVLLVGALIWATWPANWHWIRTTEWRLTIMLVPLVLLLGLWYFSPACRGAGWLPLIAVAIAAAGSFFAFKPEEVRNTQLLLIDQEDEKK